MTTTLHDLMNKERNQDFATATGNEMHLRLQRISLDAPRAADADLIARINACAGLSEFFRAPARAEVPIAGNINGRFISRRMDRVIIDDVAKTVRILDYKTDTDRTARRAKYIAQLGEYAALMRQIYPDFKIDASILWLHDWTLEKVRTIEPARRI